MKEGYDGFIITIEHSNIITNIVKYLKYNHNKKYLDSITIDEPIISTYCPLENTLLCHLSSNLDILVYIGNDRERHYYFLKVNCNNTKVVISDNVEILLFSKLHFNVFVFYNENIDSIKDEYVSSFIGNLIDCKYLILVCCRTNITKIKLI
jgi:hypothetical protein